MSIVFLDLAGFTAWSETKDAEDVRDLLSGYFDVASEGDAEGSVRAASKLVEAVTAHGEQVGVGGLQARPGVSTGQVASWTNPGKGLVTEDRVNAAARVQTAAKPGALLAGVPP